MRKYRMTTRNHLTTLAWTCPMLIPIAVFLVWFNFDMALVVISGAFVLINYLPVAYLHYTYWLTNRGEEYVITRNEVIRIRNGQEVIVRSQDIRKSIIYRSRNSEKRGRPTFGMEEYYFVRLIHNSDMELAITCLVVPNVDKVIRSLKGVPIERKRWGFCSVKRR